jgi:hypothetical protein
LNQNLNPAGKLNRASNNKSAIAYNNISASQKEFIQNTPDQKKSKHLASKLDQSDIEHLGAIAKNYTTSDPKHNGFQASMNLMDNGGKLQKLENFNTDIPQLT